MEANKESENPEKSFTKLINNNQQTDESIDCDQNELKSNQNELFDESLQFFLNDNENYDDQNENDNSDKSPNYKRQSNQLLREQDRFLPIANISRIMKNKLPVNGKISKEAKVCIQECVSEFISFITSEASERCTIEKRKTINGDDILVAMETLGFDNYIKPLKIYLQKFRKLNATVNITNNDLDPLINN